MEAGETAKSRRRRDIDPTQQFPNQTSTVMDGVELVFPNQQTPGGEKTTAETMVSKMENGYYVEFYNNETASNVHTFNLTQLKHYSMYRISVQACRAFENQFSNVNTHCSNVVMESLRTGKIGLCFLPFYWLQ